jgi:hypothetical protein
VIATSLSLWGQRNTPDLDGRHSYVSGLIADIDEVGRSYAKFKTRSTSVCSTSTCRQLCSSRHAAMRSMTSAASWIVRCIRQTGSVGAGSTNNKILWTGAASQACSRNYLHRDVSGVTLVRTIREVNPGVSLTLAYPLEVAPTRVRTSLSMKDVTEAIRAAVFLGNQVNFRGYPFVPTEETAM